MHTRRNWYARTAGLILLVLGLGSSLSLRPPAGVAAQPPRTIQPALTATTRPTATPKATPTATPRVNPAPSSAVYLPITTRNSPWKSPFGVQAELVPLTIGPVLSRTAELGAGWARMGPISWRYMQPVENGPINWSMLAGLEAELRDVKRYGIAPEIVVFNSPSWATINKPFVTSCGAIRAEKFAAFAAFMRELIVRYSGPEFDVHNWELGNEIDVDPRLVPPNNGFGCWGNANDPFYGGRAYGEMLKAVAPVMRAADPNVKIWLGGLLLDLPNTTEPGKGRPELFLQGVLEAGGAPYFDILPYHAYMPYLNRVVDPDLPIGAPWTPLGGRVRGKAAFLRAIMAKYGVDKPLFLNETALMCPDNNLPFKAYCSPPADSFYQTQAIYVVRAFARALAINVQGIIWYTINGPGWFNTGLLGANNLPTPAYQAFAIFSDQLKTAEYIGPVNYGKGVEAYAFGRFDRRVQVVWAIDDQTLAINIPQAQFVSAIDRSGNPITPIANGSDYLLLARFEPMYITLTR